MKDYKNVIHALLCLSFSVIVGAAIFEHLTIWPKAYAAPPSSLGMFQGEYGFNGAPFWQIIHPITVALFILSLGILWRSARRKYILIPFIIYILIILVSGMYFVPELIDITSTPFSNAVDPDLMERGSKWMDLSLVRLICIMVLAIVLMLGLTKSYQRVIR